MLKSIRDLKPAPWNPRDIEAESLESLKTSLSEFGDISGIVFNVRTGYLICGHQRIQGLISKYGEDNLRIEENEIVVPDGNRFFIRVVDWDELTEKAANVAANSSRLGGFFTEGLQSVLRDVHDGMPELSNDLQFDELMDSDLFEDLIPPGDKESGDEGEEPDGVGGSVVLDQALQLEPPKEYIVVVCEGSAEWEILKSNLGLGLVRRGGCKPNVKQDTLGVQRVVKASKLLGLLDRERSDADSDTE